MADDDRNDDESIVSTKKRFEIYVPEPKARINFGSPSKDPENGPFGYTGLSLQSDVHMFIDANKDLQLQATNLQMQAGGKWAQFASEDMTLSSTANVNLSADKRIVVATGAGQGSIGALDHGTNVRLVPYNSLGLHYGIDTLQVGLFEFFNGRRKRVDHTPGVKTVLVFGGADEDDCNYFDGEDAKEAQAEGLLKGGFAAYAVKSLRELYPVAKQRAYTEYGKDVLEPGDPVVLLDGLVEKKIFGGDSKATSLVYGHSKYFKRFDPYDLIDPSKLDHPLARGFAGFRNLLAKMRRFADVASKYASLLSDNFLSKRAVAGMAAVDNLAKATARAYAVIDLTFGCFEGGGHLGNAFEDERKSGWDARRGTVTTAQQAARDRALEGHKATIVSNAGPFDLRRHDPASLTMTIKAGGDPIVEKLVTLGGAPPGPAELEVTADLEAARPRLNVKVHRGFNVPQQVSDAELLAWVSETLGAELEPTSALSASGDTVSVPIGVIENLAMYGVGSTSDRSLRAVSKAWPIGGLSFSTTLSSITTLTMIPSAHDVVMSIDGRRITVTLAPEGSAFASPTAEQAYVRGAFAGAIGGSATVSAAGETFTITTSRLGPQAEILVETGVSETLHGLGLSQGQAAHGTEATSGIVGLDRRAVTAAQIVSLLGAGPAYEIATEGDSVRLRSSSPPKVGTDSTVEVSGTLADLLFSTKSKIEKAETYTDEQERAASSMDYKTLLTWNNELQKLPEDTRNLTRPITTAIHGTVGALSALEASLESVADFVGGDVKGLPQPAEAIGLFADDGITLGTGDRIIGAGGKGIVFIVDGGSGDEDHQKFIPRVESFVNLAMEWDPLDRKLKELIEGKATTPAPTKKPVPSIGFRVLADPSVDLFGSFGAELVALGRGKLAAAGPDGKQFVGLGVARLAGSYAAEVAAYRKVVISARNPGKDDKDGGRVELAGQTIAIGGMNVDSDVQDFKDKDGFGIEPLDAELIAGVEHLGDEEIEGLKEQLAAYAWPETLRKGVGAKGHASTQQVLVHAAKETIIQVGTFLVHVDATKGVTVSTRKPNEDPLTNEPDTDKPSLLLDGDKIVVSTKDGAEGVKLEMTGKKLTVTAADKSTLEISDAGIKGAGNKAFVMQGDEVKIDGTKSYTVSGQEMKYKFSGTFKIG